MSNNIVNFPSKGLNVEFTPEEEMKHDEIVNGIQSAVYMLVDGMRSNTDATWDHVFDALVNATISAGLESGLEIEDIEWLFNTMTIQGVQFDA